MALRSVAPLTQPFFLLFFGLQGHMLWLWHKTTPMAVPSAAPGVALFSGDLTSSLPLSKGGVGFVHVPTQMQSLQAKVIS